MYRVTSNRLRNVPTIAHWKATRQSMRWQLLVNGNAFGRCFRWAVGVELRNESSYNMFSPLLPPRFIANRNMWDAVVSNVDCKAYLPKMSELQKHFPTFWNLPPLVRYALWTTFENCKHCKLHRQEALCWQIS